MKGFLSFVILAVLAVQVSSNPSKGRQCGEKDCYPDPPPTPEGCGTNCGVGGGQCAKNSRREYYPHPSDCNKYIQCVHGRDQEMPCPAGLNWNDRILVCDWPDYAGCKVGSGESGGSGGSSGSECSGENGDCGETGSDGSEEGSGGPECLSSKGDCGGSGSGGYKGHQCAKYPNRGYFPHPTDCNKFIQCVHGRDQVMPCPKGLHWNDKILVCDYPKNAGCKSGSGGHKGYECTSGKGGCGGYESDGYKGHQCAKHPNRGYFPHPTDCNKFIQCVHGRDQVMPCPKGLHWNDKILVCDYPKNAGCKTGSGSGGCKNGCKD